MRHRPRRRLSRATVAFCTLLGLLAFGPASASATSLSGTEIGNRGATDDAARHALAPSAVATDDVRIEVTTPGNLFDPGVRATFGVLSARDGTVSWSVRDYRSRTVRSGTAAIDPATREGAVDAGELPLGY
ncbi:hypothetical protein ACFWMU_15345 [Streptomyces sp. NPDC058357]|uniref:hypothetical protein n=1 Tax=unclassified Streptomyces TaxID=2593676 RepID=UPI003661851F